LLNRYEFNLRVALASLAILQAPAAPQTAAASIRTRTNPRKKSIFDFGCRAGHKPLMPQSALHKLFEQKPRQPTLVVPHNSTVM
jgi:hypothetical protein